jgi:hypothetical protein
MLSLLLLLHPNLYIWCALPKNRAVGLLKSDLEICWSISTPPSYPNLPTFSKISPSLPQNLSEFGRNYGSRKSSSKFLSHLRRHLIQRVDFTHFFVFRGFVTMGRTLAQIPTDMLTSNPPFPYPIPVLYLIPVK